MRKLIPWVELYSGDALHLMELSDNAADVAFRAMGFSEHPAFMGKVLLEELHSRVLQLEHVQPKTEDYNEPRA